MSIDGDRAVGELVAERIDRSRVFDDLGIDDCRHDKVPVAEAGRRLGLDAAEVGPGCSPEELKQVALAARTTPGWSGAVAASCWIKDVLDSSSDAGPP